MDVATRRAASLSSLHALQLWEPMVFITTRHAASLRSSRYGVSLIETNLRARRGNPPKKIAPYGTFAAVSLLDYGGLKPILPFPRGRSDAACRVVVCLHALQLWEPMVFITTRHY